MPTIGYPQEWVLGGDDIPEEMICTICSELKRDAVKTVCGHSFCADCIAMWHRSRAGRPSCPLCRAGHRAAPTKDSTLQKEIQALTSKCPRCLFVGPLLEVVKHERDCKVDSRTRTCQCVICASTPNASFGAYLDTLINRSDHPGNVGHHYVMSAPRGKPYFFVRPQAGADLRFASAFVHVSAFARIISFLRNYYSCTDNTRITVPPLGAKFYAALTEDALGRARVDGDATIESFNESFNDDSDDDNYPSYENESDGDVNEIPIDDDNDESADSSEFDYRDFDDVYDDDFGDIGGDYSEESEDEEVRLHIWTTQDAIMASHLAREVSKGDLEHLIPSEVLINVNGGVRTRVGTQIPTKIRDEIVSIARTIRQIRMLTRRR